jgi:multidrug efflux pump subunit AcrA (membrane-fusion protein)
MRILSRVPIRVVGTLLLLSLGCGCKEGSVSAGENSAAQSQTRYTCPMHPQVLSEKKESCAICGMHLVPVTPDRAPPSADHLADRTTVQVAPESAKLIGVQTTRVEKRPMVIAVRSGAKAKIDPAFSNLLQQYRESSTDLRAHVGPEPTGYAPPSPATDVIVQQLEAAGITKEDIQNIKRDRLPAELAERRMLLTISVQAQDGGLIQKGQRITATTPHFSATMNGVVRDVLPPYNPFNQPFVVTAELANPKGLLKRDMYVDAVIEVDLGSRLAIPADAVIHTGTRTVVYTPTSPDTFEPREIELGVKSENFYEVASGLKEGDEVVAAGTFLLDSESQLRAAHRP